jgi:hypothetical protein
MAKEKKMNNHKTVDQKIHELKNEWNRFTYTPDPFEPDSIWKEGNLLKLIDRLTIIGEKINSLNDIPYDPIWNKNHLVSQVPHKGY